MAPGRQKEHDSQRAAIGSIVQKSGSQYISIRCTERQAGASIEP